MNMTRVDKFDKNNKISYTKLILCLIEDDYHVVFYMSFLLIEKLSDLMVEPKRGKLGRINLKPTEFKSSLVIVYSQWRIEGVTRINSSLNLVNFLFF